MPKPLLNALAIGAAGFAGALARYYLAEAVKRLFPTHFPLGTLIVNLSGCFILGWFYTATAHRLDLSDTTKLAVTVGFLGAYTTFSTLMYESATLFELQMPWRATLNMLASLTLGLLAIWLGIWCGKKL
jgi:CrcB protein